MALLIASVALGDDAAVTVSDSDAVAAVTPLPLAVTVITAGVALAVAVLPTATLTVLTLTPAPSVAVPNETVTPVGAPVAARVTSPVKLPPRTIVADAAPVPPTGKESVAGVTAMDTVPGTTGGVVSLLPPHAASRVSAAPVNRTFSAVRARMIDRMTDLGSETLDPDVRRRRVGTGWVAIANVFRRTRSPDGVVGALCGGRGSAHWR